jgi:hypothetical protein
MAARTVRGKFFRENRCELAVFWSE